MSDRRTIKEGARKSGARAAGVAGAKYESVARTLPSFMVLKKVALEVLSIVTCPWALFLWCFALHELGIWMGWWDRWLP